jgi:hypothetical protein
MAPVWTLGPPLHGAFLGDDPTSLNENIEAPENEDENEGDDEVPGEEFHEDMVDYRCDGLHMATCPLR